MRRRAGLIGTIAAALVAVMVVPAGAATSPTRYSLVHGCYAVRTAGSSADVAGGPFRMQATALGRYLLYSPARTFLADGVQGGGLLPDLGLPAVGGGGIGLATAPSPAAEWAVTGSPGALSMQNIKTGRKVGVTFTSAGGCATYPEADIDATGKPFSGPSPQGAVRGIVDAHAHITAFEFLGGDFHCGRPWAPYGAPFALPDCASIQGPQGSAAPVQNFLDYGAPEHPHDTVGWPTFKDWPGPDKLSYEGDYYTGVKRAWLGGLRIFVTDLVDNEALCTVMPMKHNPCNDMDSVRLQDKDLTELQNYIDAQSGGPGKGFFRLVSNPFQARKVISQGKLAVIEGIEVSRIFGCGENNGVSQCSKADVDRGLDELKARGITTFFPVHKFDNAFGGTKMDAGELGTIINAGNHLETGHFWDVKTCAGVPPGEHDQQQLSAPQPAGSGLATLFKGPLDSLLPGGTQVPTYPAAPHCNQRSLTGLGTYLIQQMAKRHDVLQLDHMDVKTADAALSVAEKLRYSGVVSAHSWDSPPESTRIYKLGGFVTPIAGSSPPAFVDEWRADKKLRAKRNPYRFGFGYGSDMNGLAEEAQPTSA
ncbi:MAG TPA: Coagulation factor 5/8 type domain-containing protein, partial [Solirubrobacteraceae bacterium]